jgi:hypothetical protein
MPHARDIAGVVVHTKGGNRLLVTIELIEQSRSRANSESFFPGTNVPGRDVPLSSLKPCLVCEGGALLQAKNRVHEWDSVSGAMPQRRSKAVRDTEEDASRGRRFGRNHPANRTRREGR